MEAVALRYHTEKKQHAEEEQTRASNQAFLRDQIRQSRLND